MGQTTRTTRTTRAGVIGKLLASASRQPGSSTPPPLQGATRDAPTIEEILAMSCEQFAKADLVLAVRSALLGEDIVLASDEKAASRATGAAAVYVAEEILQLYATGTLDVDALRLLHRLKRGFGDARLRGIQP